MDGERRAVWTALEASVREALTPGPSPAARERGAEGGVRVGQSPREIEVVVIRPGVSNNGLRYGERVLEESVPLWSGAPSYCDHPGPLDQGRAGGRSVRDLVGVFASPRYEAGRGIAATLRLYPHAEWLAGVVEAHLADEAAGRPTAKLGISADMVVLKERVEAVSGFGEQIERMGRRNPFNPLPKSADSPLFDVVKIVAVNSADVVMNPSAGGRFERILEGGWETGDEAQERVGTRFIAPEQEGGLQMTGELGKAGSPELSTDSGHGLGGLAGASPYIVGLCGQVLEARLAGLALPEKAKDYLRTQFKGRAFEGAELDRAIEGVRGLLGGVVAPGVITGVGLGMGRGVRVTLTGRERLQVALDRLFGVEPPDHLKDTPRLSGIREAYVAITGDRQFRGRYVVEESVLEANEVTTSVLADALADSMAKRLAKDYQGQSRWWEQVCVRVGLSDMRTQTRVLLNDFASLATVAESGAYQNAAWGDTKETYTPGKRGNLVYVTMETIINDDLRAVQRIPTKLAVAATATINEVVAGLFTANAGAGPAMADTYNVFDATNHQGNAGTSALSSTSLQAAMVALAKMTNSSGKRIGVVGRYLLVPPDLMYTAAIIAGTPQVPGSNNNDVNPLAGQIVPIVVPNFADVNNWYLLASPAQVECLEVGFLNGREEPELMVQDNPTDGSVFTNDAITFKVRHIYGAGWLDYRGAYGSIVA